VTFVLKNPLKMLFRGKTVFPAKVFGAQQRCRKSSGLYAQCWVAFTRFLDDSRICLSNNQAKRAVSLWWKILLVLGIGQAR
jgi:hypothetical protein